MSSSSYIHHILLPLLILFLFSHKASSDQQTQDLINQICNQMAPETEFCRQTLTDNLPSPSTDIYGLAKITIQQTFYNAGKTGESISNLLARETDQAVKNALIACQNAYSIIQQSFLQATVEFEEHNYKVIPDVVDGTGRALDSCLTSFDVPPHPKNPLVQQNKEMRTLLAMANVCGHVFYK
ncbi:hypothetical protein Pint_21172 [Pistacia integerrima]|uniref:Uncharacterized protein n=1 Tax=Pistacia integerrima TaxID=434235 RepID=A0ACC0X968_9ROSI|nr:hypothetical protein Pint_21172 [Pistacia integerrima]